MTDLKYILDDSGDADHHSPPSFCTSTSPSSSSYRQAHRSSRAILSGGSRSSSSSSTRPQTSGSSSRLHPTTSSHFDSDGFLSSTNSGTMDPGGYGGASLPYAATVGGYGSSHDGRDGHERDMNGIPNHNGAIGMGGMLAYGMDVHGDTGQPMAMAGSPGMISEGLMAYGATPMIGHHHHHHHHANHHQAVAAYASASLAGGYGLAGAGGDMTPRQMLYSTMPGDGRTGRSPFDEVRLTPVTRRVSRAKKGVPVHTCDLCNPPKVFTRAEHLRRHQLSHQTPGFQCTFPNCRRSFHRADLLSRHERRHRSGEESSLGVEAEAGPSTRRGSMSSTEYGSTYHGEGGRLGTVDGSSGGSQYHYGSGTDGGSAEEQQYQQYQQQFSYSLSSTHRGTPSYGGDGEEEIGAVGGAAGGLYASGGGCDSLPASRNLPGVPGKQPLHAAALAATASLALEAQGSSSSGGGMTSHVTEPVGAAYEYSGGWPVAGGIDKMSGPAGSPLVGSGSAGQAVWQRW